jgi:hypothetical protein
VDDDHNVNNQDYVYDNQGYHMDGNRDYMSDNYGNMDGYDHNQYNPPMYNMELGNNRSHEYTADSLPSMAGNTLPPMNTRTYDQQGFSNDGFDVENYHSYRQTANTVLSRPEELDEISQTDTASTHQMSNASSRVPTVDNVGPNREQHEDSEESITSIFKSLSDIQTRLASKGKQPEQGAMPRRKTRKDSGNSYAPLSYQQPPPNSAGPGAWGNEGIVEDGKRE